MSGVYQILNLINRKSYIGSTVGRFNDRWRHHISSLNRGVHHSIVLQRAWNKYGSEAFQFQVVEGCNAQSCLKREQHYLDILCPEYNVAQMAHSPMMGRKHTMASRNKMSVAKAGSRHPLFGKSHSVATRARMSKSHADVSGERNPGAKLTRSYVDEIRKALGRGVRQKDLAEKFGVSQATISQIKIGYKW